jgi:hypothetical protein
MRRSSKDDVQVDVDTEADIDDGNHIRASHEIDHQQVSSWKWFHCSIYSIQVQELKARLHFY